MSGPRQGFVLICVLWVLAVLTVVTVGFGHRAMLDRRASRYALDLTQAKMMARAAVQRGIVQVRNKVVQDAIDRENARVQDIPYVGAQTHLGQEWAQPRDLLAEGVFFDYADDLVEDVVYYEVEDMERRIDINSVPKEVLERVEALPRPAVRRIWSRRSRGDHGEEEGRSNFQAIEELRYMRGVSEEDWYGDDRTPGIRDMLTTYGTNKVNINTASAAVLRSLPGMKDGDVDEIMRHRGGDGSEFGFTGVSGLGHMDAVSNLGIRGDSFEAIQKFCKFTSNYFKITGVATRRAGKIRATCSAIVRVNRSSASLVTWMEEPFGT